jgi:hypothetical protein
MVLAVSTTRSAKSPQGPLNRCQWRRLDRAHRISLAVSKHARSARRATSFNASQRSVATMAAAPSRRRSVGNLELGWRGRRYDDQRGTGIPAASCASRFGNTLRIARCRSAVAALHSPISARVRPQPVQSPARASSAQTSTHGDLGGLVIASVIRKMIVLSLCQRQIVRGAFNFARSVIGASGH